VFQRRATKQKTSMTRKCANRVRLKNGFRFVYKAGQRWQVRVKHQDRVWYCGVYNSKEMAARAADWKVHDLGLPISKLNFPREPKSAAPPPRAVVGRINTVPRPNKTAANKTGFRGVCKRSSSGFYAQVCAGNTTLGLPGPYATAVEAARAFDRKSVEIGRGREFMNFPDTYPAVLGVVQQERERRFDSLVLGYIRDRGCTDVVDELRTFGIGREVPPASDDWETAPDGLPLAGALVREIQQTEEQAKAVELKKSLKAERKRLSASASSSTSHGSRKRVKRTKPPAHAISSRLGLFVV
jgi:hypothetical protein